MVHVGHSGRCRCHCEHTPLTPEQLKLKEKTDTIGYVIIFFLFIVFIYNMTKKGL